MRTLKKLCVAIGAMTLILGPTAMTGRASDGLSQPHKSSLVVAELFPMTGREPFVGQWFLHGAKAAIYDINHHGGVMGHLLTPVLGDTGGDPVDAVPAWRQLNTQSPTFEIGPSSLRFKASSNCTIQRTWSTSWRVERPRSITCGTSMSTAPRHRIRRSRRPWHTMRSTST
jgi:hypothetical protein